MIKLYAIILEDGPWEMDRHLVGIFSNKKKTKELVKKLTNYYLNEKIVFYGDYAEKRDWLDNITKRDLKYYIKDICVDVFESQMENQLKTITIQEILD